MTLNNKTKQLIKQARVRAESAESAYSKDQWVRFDRLCSSISVKTDEEREEVYNLVFNNTDFSAMDHEEFDEFCGAAVQSA